MRRLAAQIYSERRRQLLAIARRNAACEADAEEAVQEAFAAFIAHYDPGGGAPPIAWLTLTLKRACWRARRERARGPGGAAALSLDRGPDREQDGSLAEVVASPEAGSEARVVDLDDARRRLRALKPDERTALGMQAAGLSYREIGERRGWT